MAALYAVATVMTDASPEATLEWIETDVMYVYFKTAMHRVKARDLERESRSR